MGSALIGIVYGALVAWVQEDLKKLVAYSSIAHLGFVMLGLLAADLLAWQGALIQMVNHGLSTGALFLLVGMLYDRRHTKKFAEFGGLAKVMPWFAFFLVFSTLASVGLPGLNGFVGEFLILVGTYRAGMIWPAVVAASGVVLAAVYLLRMLHETIWGRLRKDENRLSPTSREGVGSAAAARGPDAVDRRRASRLPRRQRAGPARDARALPRRAPRARR